MHSFPNFEPVCCSTANSNCCFLTCLQVFREAGTVIWYSHLFKNFPVCGIHTAKGFNVINEAEVDVLLEFSCFFYDPTDAGNLISGSSAFSKSTWTSGSSQFTYCWRLGEFWALLCWHVRWVQLCGSLSVLWHCLSLGLEWKRTFSSPVATAEFSQFAGILSAALKKHHLLGFEIAQLQFYHLH